MFYCYFGPGRLAVLERGLVYILTSSDRFHCTTYALRLCTVLVGSVNKHVSGQDEMREYLETWRNGNHSSCSYIDV